ncbi:GNAT family N-acetyltransferase, partial [candidate division CSSED10-310 bacterium]
MDPRKYAVMTYLQDGSMVHIRAIRATDKLQLREGFHKLSLNTIYFRFHQAKQDLSARELTYFTEIDFINHVALVVTITVAETEIILAVGRYIVTASNSECKSAEVALIVSDDHQDRGIGTILFQHLVTIARAGGITLFQAEVLAINHRMFRI